MLATLLGILMAECTGGSPAPSEPEDNASPVAISTDTSAPAPPATDTPAPKATNTATLPPPTLPPPTVAPPTVVPTPLPPTGPVPDLAAVPSTEQPWLPCAQGQIKGNINSGIYHPPWGASYRRTYRNVYCFNTGAEAEAAGYRQAER